MNITGTNKIQEPQVRNYSGYFKSKAIREAAESTGYRDADAVSTNTYNVGMTEENKQSQLVSEEGYNDDMEVPEIRKTMAEIETDNQLIVESLHYLKDLNESVHGFQQIEDDGMDGDYNIDGLTPVLIKAEASASPSSIDKKSPINILESEVDPSMTKSEI